MATPDYDVSVPTRAELARLEQLERELSDRRARIHARMDAELPNPMIPRGERLALSNRVSPHRHLERQLSDERRALHGRIDRLRTLLARNKKTP